MEIDLILQSFLQTQRKSDRAPDNFDDALVAACVCGDWTSRTLLKISFRAWFVVEFSPPACKEAVAKHDQSTVEQLAQDLNSKDADPSFDRMLKNILTGISPATKIRRALLAMFGASVPPDWIAPSEIDRIKKRKRSPESCSDYREVQESQAEQHVDNIASSLGLILPTATEHQPQGLLQRSQPFAQTLPHVFPQRMCDATVIINGFLAQLVLTHWSPSFVTLDIEVSRDAVPDVVNELFSETVKYSDDKSSPGWKLILKGGSEVSLHADFDFDRVKDQGIKSLLGDQVHEAISNDPVRNLEVQRGESLTRRVSMTIRPGQSSRLRISFDSSVMASLERALWLSIF